MTRSTITFSELQESWNNPSAYTPLHVPPQTSNICEEERRQQAISTLAKRLKENGYCTTQAEAQRMATAEVNNTWRNSPVAMPEHAQSSVGYTSPTKAERDSLAARIETLQRIHPGKSYAECAVLAEQ